MTSNHRRGFAQLLFLFFACWPLCHLALGLQGYISPWKLGGFGMYAVPSERVSVRWAACDGTPLQVPPSLRKLESDFIARFQALPRTSRPEALYLALLARVPEHVCLEAEVSREHISSLTKRWERRRTVFRFVQ